jgi:hypothetical protein
MYTNNTLSHLDDAEPFWRRKFEARGLGGRGGFHVRDVSYLYSLCSEFIAEYLMNINLRRFEEGGEA